MKRNLSLVLTLAVLTAPAALGMKYATVIATPILTAPINALHPLVNNFSGCTSDSNTIAVGYEFYAGGFRMLCADAGRIGFWTIPVAAARVGQAPDAGERFLCPSGSALAGVQYVEGLLFPFPLCGELIPDFTSGQVHRTVLFSVDATVVEKESKGPPVTPGVVSCGVGGYVQTLQASRSAAGNVTGFTALCNSIVTDPVEIKKGFNVDLAVKAVNQTAVLGRNATQLFHVDVFNLGAANIPASNISLEVRFDGSAWQVLPFNMVCSDILAHSGVVDLIVVGERCTLPSPVAGQGGVVPVSFRLEPLGPDTTRPATPTPQPILSVKASIINEQLEGADANATNDTAAFPVILQ
jgi:hypothetical protein